MRTGVAVGHSLYTGAVVGAAVGEGFEMMNEGA